MTWPTHRAKARDRATRALSIKKRNRKIRRLNKDGKRGGPVEQHLN